MAAATTSASGHHVEYTNPNGAHYEESDYTSYEHSAAETDHIFAAEGSESSHTAEYSQLDALQARPATTRGRPRPRQEAVRVLGHLCRGQDAFGW